MARTRIRNAVGMAAARPIFMPLDDSLDIALDVAAAAVVATGTVAVGDGIVLMLAAETEDVVAVTAAAKSATSVLWYHIGTPSPITILDESSCVT